MGLTLCDKGILRCAGGEFLKFCIGAGKVNIIDVNTPLGDAVLRSGIGVSLLESRRCRTPSARSDNHACHGDFSDRVVVGNEGNFTGFVSDFVLVPCDFAACGLADNSRFCG